MRPQKKVLLRARSLFLALILTVLSLPNAGAIDHGWLWPVPSSHRLSRGFYAVGESAASPGGYHYAIDIKPPEAFRLTAALDTPVIAARSGKIVLVYSGCFSHNGTDSYSHAGCSPLITIDGGSEHEGQKTGGICNYQLGNAVFIDHGDGYYSAYGHLASICVSAGQSVEKGEIIGWMGSSGLSSGKHLDFSIRLYTEELAEYIKGTPINVNPSGGDFEIVDYPGLTNGVGGIVYETRQDVSDLFPNGFSPLNSAYYAAKEPLRVYYSPSSVTTLSLTEGEIVSLSEKGIDETGKEWARIGTSLATHDEYAGLFLPMDGLVPVGTGAYRVHPDLSAYLNLRTSPSASSDRIASLSPGTEITITELSGEWGKAYVPSLSVSGWVCIGYLQKTADPVPLPNDLNGDGSEDVLDLLVYAENVRTEPDSSSLLVERIGLILANYENRESR